MNFKEKLIFGFLSVITLGIYPLVIFNKKPQKINKELSESEIKLNIDKLVEHLGSKKNITIIEYSHTKLKIFFNFQNKINLEKIKNMKTISGVVITSSSISLIVGNQAKSIANKLMSNIKKETT